jgi:hypothetical protein
MDKADERLLMELGRTLGLKADKIDDLQRNARTVAREDYRKRVWGSPDYPADRLLYPCEEGAPSLLHEHIGVFPPSTLTFHSSRKVSSMVIVSKFPARGRHCECTTCEHSLGLPAVAGRVAKASGGGGGLWLPLI